MAMATISTDNIAMDPVLWGVDRIELIPNHEGRYIAKTSVRGPFVWSSPRERERQCDMFHWWIGGQRFAGVVPVTFDDDGNVNTLAMAFALQRMIEASTQSATQ